MRLDANSIAQFVWKMVAVINRAVNPTMIDGVAFTTHVAGQAPADLRNWLGAAPNALISGRVDANAQVVGDKTGYSLTAGSYSVRASSVQRGVATGSGAAATATTFTVSSVTTTRAPENWCGGYQSATPMQINYEHYMQLTSSTVVTWTFGTNASGNADALRGAMSLPEFF